MLICLCTGFSSGLPLYLLATLLPAWLKSEGLDLTTIGFMTLTQYPFICKFLWAPALDRYAPPLGRRRGWILIGQIGVFVCMGCLGGFDPQRHIVAISVLATLLAFFAATQDVALDAFRREILADAELGLGNAMHVNAYRAAGLVPGSLSLYLADATIGPGLPWHLVFWITALFMLPGMVMALKVREPLALTPPKTLQDACVLPFKDFMQRHGWRQAGLLLSFLVFYKLGDSLATALSSAYYLDMGFSLAQIALIAKHAGLWPMVFGGVLGGLLMVKIGINRALWLFGMVQLVTILGFAWLASIGPFPQVKAFHLWALAGVIAAEYLGVGLGTAAFIAFIARATNPAYTAAQFALFTSLTAVPRTLINAWAGKMAEALGWTNFFLLCTALAVPGMLLLFKVAPWNGGNQESGARNHG
jgi:PAT family beta-lactamase induction signal transducer AmpG